MSYHANYFKLRRHEALPVRAYSARINPPPSTKPQGYQILGRIARKLTSELKAPVISTQGRLEILGTEIPPGLLSQHAHFPEIHDFDVELNFDCQRTVQSDESDEYKLLLNRIIDTALTVLSSDYYKFHPDAPYVIRDEPYFDDDLIAATGIIDSKKYYRSLHRFNAELYLLVNRETELRSNKNLLNEIHSLATRFGSTSKPRTVVDVHRPQPKFVDYVNALLRGKAASVLGYPGPGVHAIEAVDWSVRAKDKPTGARESCVDYLKKNYGIVLADENQPTIRYTIGREGALESRYHVPELLSVGHDFEDLAKRIPPWQRSQVWNYIHPNCKNHLQKIFEVVSYAVETLTKCMPDIYPKLLEIDTSPLNVTQFITPPPVINIQFKDKSVRLKAPYDVSFYRNYTDKDHTFKNPLPNCNAFLHNNDPGSLDEFLGRLKTEFKTRNGTELIVTEGQIDLTTKNYKSYDIILTIGEVDGDTGEYDSYKKVIQNEDGMVHQHITRPKAVRESVMQVVMQLALKKGADPWLLEKAKMIDYVTAVYRYRPNEPGLPPSLYFNLCESTGKLVYQSTPYAESDEKLLIAQLSKTIPQSKRVLVLLSFDNDQLESDLESMLNGLDAEFSMVRVRDLEESRIYSTWVPEVPPVVSHRLECPVEAYEEAPHGVKMVNKGDGWYLLTGRTIEKETLKRGCPTPIFVAFRRSNSTWNEEQVADYLLSLCFMWRGSGHMVRLPAPLYYLRSLASYVHKYGLPSSDSFRQTLFHI